MNPRLAEVLAQRPNQPIDENDFDQHIARQDEQLQRLFAEVQRWPVSPWRPWVAGQQLPMSNTPSFDPMDTWDLLDNMPTKTRRSY